MLNSACISVINPLIKVNFFKFSIEFKLTFYSRFCIYAAAPAAAALPAAVPGRLPGGKALLELPPPVSAWPPGSLLPAPVPRAAALMHGKETLPS